jgi:eukaryotic-like serine/threonine-protein kinase
MNDRMGSSAPPAQVTLEPGTRLDRYELLCVLAHGGMANVWLARVQGKHGFERLYAVKTILPNVADDEAFKTMFLDEARIATRIEHPNVVHMTDVGEASKIAYLVMDLVEGEPLHRLPRACEKRGQRIPLGVVLRIIADACHGLHAAHELCDAAGVPLGVVHRDMSPSNILISSAGVAKVIDFGVAKARDRSTGQTTVGTLKGKISYMPREQALGRDVDRRADTWALGAVLYYLLAGRPPYKEEQQLATLQLAMNGAPIPPLPANLPITLRTAVNRALAHEPSQRFQTAAEMGEALESLMRKLGVVTTHAQVGTFVQQALGEKFDARKKLVASALAEAANREQSRSALSALTIPIDLDGAGESGSHSGALIAVPTAVMSAPRYESSPDHVPDHTTGSGPLSLASEHKTDGSTGAAFVTGPVPLPPQRTRLLPALVAGTGALALIGVVLIAFSLRAKAPQDPTVKAAGGHGDTAAAASATSDVPSVAADAASPSIHAGGTGVAASARPGEPSAKATSKAALNWPPPPPAGKGITTPPPGPAAAPAKGKGREDYGF